MGNCQPCFPYSRCGLSGNDKGVVEETVEEEETAEEVVEEEEAEKSSSDDATSDGTGSASEDELFTSEVESSAHRTTGNIASWILAIAAAGISWFLVVA